MTTPPAHHLEAEASQNGLTLWPVGAWDLAAATAIEKNIAALGAVEAGAVSLDLTRLDRIDTTGAMLLWQLYDNLSRAGHVVGFANIGPSTADLLQAVGDSRNQPMPKAVCTTGLSAVRHRVELLGRNTTALLEEAVCFLSFLGLITITIGRSMAQPRRFRFAAMCHHLEQTGLRAMPIIGLLGFLIGVVISYQGAQQLQQFGAELYTVNLLGVSILREIGVLMTAIIIAGRSGSAFTAQIGTMKVNQEIDALQTMGLSPSELLVLPRVVALVITLPLLTLYSNLLALLGGALMCWAQLGISLGQFLHQLQDAVDLWTLWVGLIKAPVFAFVIGVVGCYQGLRVEGSAESVGALTTRSVVHAIFLVILLDAIFSVMFAWLGI